MSLNVEIIVIDRCDEPINYQARLRIPGAFLVRGVIAREEPCVVSLTDDNYSDLWPVVGDLFACCFDLR